MGSQSKTGRWLGSGLALLFLVTQLSSFTHLLLVRHATCLAHGELIDLDASEVARAPAAEGQAWVAVPATFADHGDQHCAVSTSRREKLGLSPAVRPVLSSSGVPPSMAAPEAAPFVKSVALLRLAPKSSPPV
jgi:hypothetical protein